jgi:hypothetical protein
MLWDAATGERLGSFTHHRAGSVLVTPDGKRADATGTTVLMFGVPAGQ